MPNERGNIIAISLGGAAARVDEAPIEADALALKLACRNIERATRNGIRFFAGPLGGPLSRAALAYGEIALGVDRRELRPTDSVARVC